MLKPHLVAILRLAAILPLVAILRLVAILPLVAILRLTAASHPVAQSLNTATSAVATTILGSGLHDTDSRHGQAPKKPAAIVYRPSPRCPAPLIFWWPANIEIMNGAFLCCNGLRTV